MTTATKSTNAKNKAKKDEYTLLCGAFAVNLSEKKPNVKNLIQSFIVLIIAEISRHYRRFRFGIEKMQASRIGQQIYFLFGAIIVAFVKTYYFFGL